MGTEAYWTAVGIITAAVVGLVGNAWLQWRKKRDSRGALATQGGLELEKANTERPWSETKWIVAELKADVDKLEAKIERQSALIDRLRGERDAAYVRAHQSELAAQTAAAYVGQVEQLQQMLRDERVAYVEHLDRLEADIARLRQDAVQASERHNADIEAQTQHVIAAIREKQHELEITRSEVWDRDATIRTLQDTISQLRGRQTGPLS